jgi:hypothetical protein
MGLNSPRTSAGAAGFMSHMSRWLGPPLRKMTMQESARAFAGRRLSACSRRGRFSPSSPAAPACSTARRDGIGPGQGGWAEGIDMAAPLEPQNSARTTPPSTRTAAPVVPDTAALHR